MNQSQNKSPNIIRVKRMARGWSGAELARRMGVSRQFISALETGEALPGPSLVPKLATVFGEPAESFARELEEARLSMSAA